MRILSFLLLFFPLLSTAQHYVDLFKVNYGETFKNDFKDYEGNTKISTLEASFTLPFPLSETQAIVTGIDYTKYQLRLFPNLNSDNLHNSVLKIGLASAWNEKWSSNIILLPKLAGNYKYLSNRDFFMGLYAVFKYKKQENFAYRIGLYASQEAYGVFATPILGWYYLSPDEKFEMNMNLPIDGDINYNWGKITTGIHYVGISRSFNHTTSKQFHHYIDVNTIQFAGYLQKPLFDNQLLLRGKFGYATNQFELYQGDEKVDLKLSAFTFGDKRHQLNPDIKAGFFFRVEAVYRFHLPAKEN